MVFNTGAALLDAIVLAVVSKEHRVHTDTRSPRMYAGFWTFRNPPFTRYCADCRRMTAWRCMIRHMQAEPQILQADGERESAA